MGKEALFGIVQRKNSLKFRYLKVAFLYALRGMSHCITSRDFVCQSPNQKPQIFLRLCSLGGYRPQSPEKMNGRRNNVYERYTNCRACHGKRKR